MAHTELFCTYMESHPFHPDFLNYWGELMLNVWTTDNMGCV